MEAADHAGGVIGDLLRAVREHFGMDVAFVSEFTGGQRVFRFVDAGAQDLVVVGAGDPLDSTYCKHIVDGALPAIIPDVGAESAVSELGLRSEGIGSHLGVPITFPDGRIYGTLCCVGNAPTELGLRELAALTLVADVVAAQLQRVEDHLGDVVTVHDTIARVIDEELFHIVFQPIVDLSSGAIVGVEALTRFTAEPQQGPDKWFAAAASVDLAVELELAAAAMALSHLDEIPPGAYMSVNLSPAVLIQAVELLGKFPGNRVVVELTEHEVIEDYDALTAATGDLRKHGVRFAIDDAGAGYSSLSHVLRLKPDVVKLDLALVRDIDTDLARQALGRAMAEFAASFGATIVAEGIETAAELRILARLGVACGQGYHLARPGPLPLPPIDAAISAHPVAPRDVVDAVHYVFRKSPMAITIATTDGRFVVANQAASEVYGRPVEEFPGRSWQDVGGHSNLDEIVESYTRAVTGEADVAAFATDVVRPDGTQRQVMVSGHPIRDGAGEVLWFFNVLQPV